MPDSQMTRPRVLVTERMDPIGVETLAREADVVELYATPGARLEDHLADVDAIVVRILRITGEHIRTASRLKVIGKHGIGVDNVDLAAATGRGIPVVFTPGSNAEAVAEHALLLMLMLARRVEPLVALARAGRFDEGRGVAPGLELLGKTLGLIGVGRIGGRLGEICRLAFGMRVLGYDPHVSPARSAELGVELTSDVESVLRQADFVSIHAPLTPETHHVVGAAGLRQMKPTAFLINCARGGLVDEAALAEALRAGVIAGAGIDVFAEEPPPTDHPLFSIPSCIVTPHVAGGSLEARVETARMVAEEVLCVLRGESPRHPVNPEVLAVRR